MGIFLHIGVSKLPHMYFPMRSFLLALAFPATDELFLFFFLARLGRLGCGDNLIRL
jgi:hypothetical protein